MLLAVVGLGLAVVGVFGFVQADRVAQYTMDLFGRPTRARVDQAVWEAAAMRLVSGLTVAAGVGLMLVSVAG